MAYEDKLYGIAMVCAEYNHNGCNRACGTCQFNVFNYVDDIREAGILKATAYRDYESKVELQRHIRQDNIATMAAPFVVIGIIVMICMWMYKSITNPSQTIPVAQINQTLKYYRSIDIPADDSELIYLMRNQDKMENIPRVLALMRKYGVKDMNRDGMVNCIDNAITFRNLYGKTARIYHIKSVIGDMNHLFIMVRYPEYPNEPLYIEPQGDPDWYTMGQVWGVRFSPYLSSDVTSTWGQYLGY